MGARFLMLHNGVRVQSIRFAKQWIEVHYSIEPLSFDRVAIYSYEEFGQWVFETHKTDEKTVCIHFFTENFEDMMALLIEEFHFEQLPIQAEQYNKRLTRIVNALERRIRKIIKTNNK